MELVKTYKFKLKPTEKQILRMDSWIHTCRNIYNIALQERIEVYKAVKKSVSQYEQYNQLPQIKKEFLWVADVYSNVLEDSLDRLDRAYKTFFRGGGFPKFAKKREYKSFTFKRFVRVEDDRLHLPKLGRMKYFKSREVEGKVKTATIVKEDNGWFICIVAEYQVPHDSNEVDNQNPIGLDCGANRFLALSNNNFIDSPEFFKPFERELRILQRKLSRQKKDSKSREKTKLKIRRINLKIRNKRFDFLHKTTTNLVKDYSAIYMEDLNLVKMQGDGLSEVNKKMSDKSFGMFKILLSYKAKERNVYLGLVNPAYTSQTCSSCKTVDKKSRLSQSEFVCTNCGEISNADSNASKNILREGISESTQRKVLA